MVSNLTRASLVALAISAIVPAAHASYLDTMSALDAKIQLVNKQNELNNAIKNGSQTVFLPTVRSIIVDEHGPSAQVVYKSGVSRWVKPGDALAGNIRVASISGNTVTAVTQKGQRANLDFYAENDTSTGTQLGSVNEPAINMPPIPVRPLGGDTATPQMGQQPATAAPAAAQAPALPVAPVPAR